MHLNGTLVAEKDLETKAGASLTKVWKSIKSRTWRHFRMGIRSTELSASREEREKRRRDTPAERTGVAAGGATRIISARTKKDDRICVAVVNTLLPRVPAACLKSNIP